MKAHARFRWVAAAAVLAALGCSTSPPGPESRGASGRAAARPNIVICIADDWSYPHARAYGDTLARTPSFDSVAKDGFLFRSAYCASPVCAPSRLAILTGQYPHRLNEGANQHVMLSKSWAVYTEMLEKAGYFVGYSGKGCAPGLIEGTAWGHDPAGREYQSFFYFLVERPEGSPFCFWVGSHIPHRPYEKQSGSLLGAAASAVTVPGFLPATDIVRADLLDYYHAVSQFDDDLKVILLALEQRGIADNTIVVVTSDNGMPFPRAKANCYDAGTRVPLAIRWPARIRPGQASDDFVSLIDLAPTFLEAAGLEPLPEMNGKSLLGTLTGARRRGSRDRVFVERERLLLGRGVSKTDSVGFSSYPIRGVRTRDFLYLWNLRPHLWPMGDPPLFADVDRSPSKHEVKSARYGADPMVSRLYAAAFEPRPAEELYALGSDPYQLDNLAGRPEHEKTRRKLRAVVEEWMKKTDDPRAKGEDDRWDYCPYFDYRDGTIFVPKRPGKQP